MKTVYNFNAGPAGLPRDILAEAAAEMLNYKGTGISVMEMSHRSREFEEIITEAEADLRDLMGIPDTYDVLFLQGGAWTQFSAVPMNLMQNGLASYILTGSWAEKAAKEAARYGNVEILASGKDENYTYIPDLSNLEISDTSDYVYICENNTIYGTRFTELPDPQGKPLVADLSSSILSEPIDVERYGLIFAGAQKNLGPAGLTLVIIRKDLIREDVHPATPTLLKYKTQADSGSLFNTPPTYAIYLCGKIFKRLKNLGGLEAMADYNREKASLLYDYLDRSTVFHGTVKREDRSLMNVCFTTRKEELDRAFVLYGEENGLIGLKGHRSVGGMRASIYNAMTLEGVEALIAAMQRFEEQR